MITIPTNQFLADFDEIYTGATTNSEARWMATDFYDKVILTAPSVQPIYYKPGLSSDVSFGRCRPVPGLPDSDGWDGVSEFAGHLLFWRGVQLLWSDLNDFANYIPVSLTASSGRGVVASGFVMPELGSETDFVFMNSRSGEFTVGQFVRVVSDESSPSNIRYSYFKVGAVSSSDESTTSIAVSQIAPAGEETTIYTTSHITFVEGSKVSIDGVVADLLVVDSSRNVTQTYQLGGSSSVVGNVGESVTFPLSTFPFDLKVGDIISVSVKNAVGQDLYRVDTVGLSLKASRLGVGEDQKPIGQTYAYGGSNPTVYVYFQPWVKVNNVGTNKTVPQTVSVVPADGLKLVPQGLTGEVPVGVIVPSGSIVETLDANEAGGLSNIGSGVNGSIFAVTKLADYAYILKQNSIQSIQYVGRESGTFYVRGEIYEEGPVGRSAWCRIDEKGIVFWGSKGWYEYRGGQNMTELGKEIWETVFDEFDRTRANEIVALHNKPRNEVWFVYPVVGSRESKVVVLNYMFKTAVIDTYPDTLNGITALGMVDWEISPTWDSLPASELINSAAKRWYEYVEEGLRQYPVIAVGGAPGNEAYGEDPDADVPRLLAHGRVPYRAVSDDCDPGAVPAFAETPDFDWGDPSAVKYINFIRIGLYVTGTFPGPARLKVMLGTRMNQDSAIEWTDPAQVDVTGGGNIVTRVNLRGAGRYARLKFLSDAPESNWSIASYEIYARVGNTF